MTITEIKYKIAEIDQQIIELKKKRCQANEELRKAVQASFEAEHGVKEGDIIKTTYGMMYYDGMVIDTMKQIVCLCHPKKKDGTISAIKKYLYWNDFV